MTCTTRPSACSAARSSRTRIAPPAHVLILIVLAATALCSVTARAQVGAAPAGVRFATVDAQPARPLSPQGRRNLIALAHVAALLQYFHPADEAAAAHWPGMLPALVAWFEAAPDDAALVSRLEALLTAFGPGTAVWTGRAADGPPRAAPVLGAGEWRRREYRGFPASPATGQGPYRAERPTEPGMPAAGDDEPTVWLTPGYAIESEPVPGVRLRMPVRAPVEEGRTTPAGDGAWTPPVEVALDDRHLRLAAFMQAWGALRHFFPYADVTGIDWNAELRTGLERSAEDDSVAAHVETLQRFLSALQDGHAVAFNRASAPGAALPWQLAWIGDDLVVAAVPDGAVAAPGDRVLSVEGIETAELLEQATARASGGETWTRSTVARRPLPASMARRMLAVELDAPDGTRRSVMVEAAFLAPDLLAEARPRPIAALEPDVMYVDLGRTNDADLRDAIPDLANAKGILFDMRGYPRGVQPWFLTHLTRVPLHSATWSVPAVRLPYGQHWEFDRSRWTMQPASAPWDAEVVFLIGGGSISYAESLMGIVEHYGLGTLVGEPTAGANGNVTFLELPGGSRIAWTGMKVVKHDGSTHHTVGILPDVTATPTRAGLADGRDEVLEAGLEILRARIDDRGRE